jgi:hypothetical protein
MTALKSLTRSEAEGTDAENVATKVLEISSAFEAAEQLECTCEHDYDACPKCNAWIAAKDKVRAALAQPRAAGGDWLRDTLAAHWLTGIKCDHADKTDVATCYCTIWRSEPMPSVGAAVNAWIDHVLDAAPLPALPHQGGESK